MLAHRSLAKKSAETILYKSLMINGNKKAIQSDAATESTHSLPPRGVLVITDAEPCSLAKHVQDGYNAALQAASSSGTLHHETLRFNASTFGDDLAAILAKRPFTACVLIQNNAFQNELKSYRLRLRLFELGLRVAEHNHLQIMSNDPQEVQPYLEACGFNPDVAYQWGNEISDVLDRSIKTTIHSVGGHELVFDGKLEPCLLNTGKYAAAMNEGNAEENDGKTQQQRSNRIGHSIGGTYPIGEVITEAETFATLNGSASFFATPDTSKKLTMCDPFVMHVEKGIVKEVEPLRKQQGDIQAIKEVVELVREIEHDAMFRELGIGLNPFVGKWDGGLLSDVTAFERQAGVHVSLGKRHPLFVKKDKSLRRKDGKFHIDLFIDATDVIAEVLVNSLHAGGDAKGEVSTTKKKKKKRIALSSARARYSDSVSDAQSLIEDA